MSSQKRKKKFVLIDANALVHRGFHALPVTLTTKKGEIVNAVYGFTMVLLNVLEKLKPHYIAACFDLGAPTFRHKESSAYKAHREKGADELYAQIPRVKEILRAFNIPIFEKKRFEADDLIGSLSHQITQKTKGKMQSVIVTGDLDTLQLIDENTQVYTLRKGVKDTVTYNEKMVRERYGLLPAQLPDFKGLAGDASDNIPGVYKVGEKTAAELLKAFGSLEKLYNFLEKHSREDKLKYKNLELKGSLLENLRKSKKDAFLSKKLGTIITNIPVKLEMGKCLLADFDRGKVLALFRELEFQSLITRIPASNKESPFLGSGKPQKEGRKYQIIKSLNELNNLIVQLREKAKKGLCIDTETTSESPMLACLVGISLSFKPKEAFYIPIRYQDQEVKYGDKSALGLLRPVLEAKNLPRIGHNLKYDYIVLARTGVKMQGIYFDTMLASYLLAPGSRAHSLDTLSFTLLGYEKIKTEELIGKGKKQITMNLVSLPRVSEYACEDVDMTLRLKPILEERLKAEKLNKLFFEVEMPLVPILAQMELNGIKINQNYLKDLDWELSVKIRAIQKRIYNQASQEFNINSTRELEQILFTKLGLPTVGIKRTKTGYSTAAGELAKLREAHPVISLISQYRELSKLKSTYVEALPRLVNPETGRVHTSFNQTITSTGRLSSSDPNLQNIPIRTNLGREIRRAFIPEPGYKLLALDYSQIDLRVVAHLSRDSQLIEAFRLDQDIHTATAAKIYGVNLEDVTPRMRRAAKAVNFGLIYGMSVYGLAETLKISREEAQEFIENYFGNYPALEEYVQKVIRFAKKHGYVKTLLGRKRLLPEIRSSQPQVVRAAERMAINMPSQGMTADIIKMAMCEVSHVLPSDQKECRLLLQVHDDLLLEVKKEKVKFWAKRLKKIMENVYKLAVPLKVEVSIGDNWGKMKKSDI